RAGAVLDRVGPAQLRAGLPRHHEGEQRARPRQRPGSGPVGRLLRPGRDRRVTGAPPTGGTSSTRTRPSRAGPETSYDRTDVSARVIGVGCALAAAIAAASASAATPPKPIPIQPIPVNPGGPNRPATTATLSSAKAGAKPVALTLKVHYEMVCGQPGLGKAIVSLPDAAVVPKTIDTASVLVDGKQAPAVST